MVPLLQKRHSMAIDCIHHTGKHCLRCWFVIHNLSHGDWEFEMVKLYPVGKLDISTITSIILWLPTTSTIQRRIASSELFISRNRSTHLHCRIRFQSFYRASIGAYWLSSS